MRRRGRRISFVVVLARDRGVASVVEDALEFAVCFSLVQHRMTNPLHGDAHERISRLQQGGSFAASQHVFDEKATGQTPSFPQTTNPSPTATLFIAGAGAGRRLRRGGRMNSVKEFPF